MQVADLIERAKERQGSYTAVGKALGVSPQRVNDWLKGYRPCPIAVQVTLCGLAGLSEGEAMQYVWEVVRERAGKYQRGAVSGVVALIAFTAAAFAPPAQAHGEEPFRSNV